MNERERNGNYSSASPKARSKNLGLETDSAVVEDLRIDTVVYCFGASAGTIRRQSFTNLNVVRIVVIDACG